MTADGLITARSRILEQQDARNKAIAEEFEHYLELHPSTDPYEQENIQRLFEAYATDEATRFAIDSEQYGTLGNAITVRQFRQVPLEHRQAIPDYIKGLDWLTTS